MITHIIFFCYLLIKVLKPRLIGVFVGVVAGGILIVGYLFNMMLS